MHGDLIDMLNQAIELELQAFLQFHYQSLKLKGIANVALREMLAEEAGNEIEHAKKLAERVVALGGEPSQTIRPVRVGDTPEEMIRLDIEREEQAIALYRAIVARTRAQEGYELVYYTALEILGDELEDKEEFEALLD